MATKSLKKGASLLDRVMGNRPEWRTAANLLEERAYEALAEVLQDARAQAEQAGDPVLATLLATTEQICLTCSHYRTEVETHQQVYQAAIKREQQLQQRLRVILNLINQEETAEGQKLSEAVVTAERSPLWGETSNAGLWQRVQNLLGRSPRGPPLLEPEMPAGSIITAPSLLPEKAETPAALPTETVEEKEERGQPSFVGYCLGSFRIYQNDELIAEWSSLKGQSILKYLVMHQGGPVAKDILMDVFWPEVDPGDTRRNLHQAIYSLRQTLRQGQPDLQPILFQKDCYLLNPEMVIWLDFEEFEKHFQAGRRLEAAGQLAVAMAEYSVAEALYQGDFLEEDLYEDWPTLQREHLRNLYMAIASRLSDYYVQEREFTAAIALCQKILTKDNCYEEAHRRLMQCYLAQGQRHLAVRQYQTCVRALKEELDLAPAQETMALYQRITAR